MKNEIKDLLQYLKNVYESEETSTWLNKLQIKDLLDYITNLQEKYRQTKLLKERYQIEKEDYKTRNEKAVEYITTGQFIKWGKSLYARILKDLLEILQGKSDE